MQMPCLRCMDPSSLEHAPHGLKETMAPSSAQHCVPGMLSCRCRIPSGSVCQIVLLFIAINAADSESAIPELNQAMAHMMGPAVASLRKA